MFGKAKISALPVTTVKFNPPIAIDIIQRAGSQQTIQTKHQCMTAMKEYENKSLEELRMEDYAANRKGPSLASGMGTEAAIGTTLSSLVGFSFRATSSPQTCASNLITGVTTGFSFGAFPFGTTTTSNLFGSTTTTTSNLFGPAVATTTAPALVTGLFGLSTPSSTPSTSTKFSGSQMSTTIRGQPGVSTTVTSTTAGSTSRTIIDLYQSRRSVTTSSSNLPSASSSTGLNLKSSFTLILVYQRLLDALQALKPNPLPPSATVTLDDFQRFFRLVEEFRNAASFDFLPRAVSTAPMSLPFSTSPITPNVSTWPPFPSGTLGGPLGASAPNLTNSSARPLPSSPSTCITNSTHTSNSNTVISAFPSLGNQSTTRSLSNTDPSSCTHQECMIQCLERLVNQLKLSGTFTGTFVDENILSTDQSDCFPGTTKFPCVPKKSHPEDSITSHSLSHDEGKILRLQEFFLSPVVFPELDPRDVAEIHSLLRIFNGRKDRRDLLRFVLDRLQCLRKVVAASERNYENDDTDDELNGVNVSTLEANVEKLRRYFFDPEILPIIEGRDLAEIHILFGLLTSRRQLDFTGRIVKRLKTIRQDCSQTVVNSLLDWSDQTESRAFDDLDDGATGSSEDNNQRNTVASSPECDEDSGLRQDLESHSDSDLGQATGKENVAEVELSRNHVRQGFTESPTIVDSGPRSSNDNNQRNTAGSSPQCDKDAEVSTMQDVNSRVELSQNLVRPDNLVIPVDWIIENNFVSVSVGNQLKKAIVKSVRDGFVNIKLFENLRPLKVSTEQIYRSDPQVGDSVRIMTDFPRIVERKCLAVDQGSAKVHVKGPGNWIELQYVIPFFDP